jgi:hypothetical protein
VKTCFVSSPLGKKTDPVTGMTIDFDEVYRTLIRPAMDGTEYNVMRIDDVAAISDMQRAIIEAVLTSDMMIVDLTTHNPNVFYELGLRHMAQRGLTIMICAAGTRIPANISDFRVIPYELTSNGNVSESSIKSFHQLLRYSVESNLEQTAADSPVYRLFPSLKLQLPEELAVSESKRKANQKIYRDKPLSYKRSSNREESIENLKGIQSDVMSNQDVVDPIEYISLLKSYRDVSAWQDLIKLAEEVPPHVAKTPEVQQLYALALNRIGKSGQAIDVIEKLIAQTGGDSETFGILGRIYKDLYETHKLNDRAKAAFYLDKAIDSYRQGFEKQPSDYYPGVNVVTLLLQQHTPESKKELDEILPRVRKSLENRMADGPQDYWNYSTAMELACIAKEWEKAIAYAESACKQKPSGWMVESTVRNLSIMQEGLNESESDGIAKVIAVLHENFSREEGLVNA